MPTKHTSHWLIDTVLFTDLIAAFFLDLIGLELLQWLSVGTGVIALYHLLAHWQGVSAVTGQPFLINSPPGYWPADWSIRDFAVYNTPDPWHLILGT